LTIELQSIFDCRREKEKMADNDIWTEASQREDLEEVMRTFREKTIGQEEAAARAAERERIAWAISGEGVFLLESSRSVSTK
jgi:hypothetical protein